MYSPRAIQFGDTDVIDFFSALHIDSAVRLNILNI